MKKTTTNAQTIKLQKKSSRKNFT